MAANDSTALAGYLAIAKRNFPRRTVTILAWAFRSDLVVVVIVLVLVRPQSVILIIKIRQVHQEIQLSC